MTNEFSSNGQEMLGDFFVGKARVAPRQGTIELDGSIEQIESRLIKLLMCLAEHPNEAVSRQKIQETVWSTGFVSDESLTQAISKLRLALGDNSRSPHIIQTVPKIGYKLIAEVTRVYKNKEKLSSSSFMDWSKNQLVPILLFIIMLIGLFFVTQTNLDEEIEIEEVEVDFE